MKKRFLKLGIPAVLLVLFIILTVVLCCSTVFNGKYKGENPLTTEYKYEVVFNGKTVTYTESKKDEWHNDSLGFYSKTEDGIELNLITPNKQVVELNRKSVFTLTQTVYAVNIMGGPIMNMSAEMELKCYSAIWLQVFYSVGMVASVVFLIVQIVMQRKK